VDVAAVAATELVDGDAALGVGSAFAGVRFRLRVCAGGTASLSLLPEDPEILSISMDSPLSRRWVRRRGWVDGAEAVGGWVCAEGSACAGGGGGWACAAAVFCRLVRIIAG